MKTSLWISSAVTATAVAAGIALGPGLGADGDLDWGLLVQRQLNERSELLFGVRTPLSRSALGPYTDADSTNAIRVAEGLRVSLVSSAVGANTDMIALWPNDRRPTHLFVCVETSTNAVVQRVDLSQSADSNATTILSGLVSCDPIRRTPWGSLIAAEEANDGGVYEIFDPLSITSAVTVTDRAAGTTSDPRVVKRKALGALAFEGNPVLPDGTIIFGDELRPGSGNPGGGIFKFVPEIPYEGGGVITVPAQSPFVSGHLFGLKVGSTGDNGQGTEIGQGFWIPINETVVPALVDANGNIGLRKAQTALKLTGYYRPEDMDIDPVAKSNDEVRVCWTDTGRMSNGAGSVEETGSIYGEVMCLTDEPDSAADSGAIPTVRRFIAGNPQFNYFDNVAFQPNTGNLAITEDGEVEVVKKDGTTELRGNDILLCLTDGDDDDVQNDGCIRIASLRDTASEPTGIIFTGSGDTLYVSMQHRATGVGALLKITGFDVKKTPTGATTTMTGGRGGGARPGDTGSQE
jgi:secreted PhoX family phosphatase